MMLTSCKSLPTQTIEITKTIPCEALKPISYSGKSDSEQTKTEIKEFNAVYKSLCISH